MGDWVVGKFNRKLENKMKTEAVNKLHDFISTVVKNC